MSNRRDVFRPAAVPPAANGWGHPPLAHAGLGPDEQAHHGALLALQAGAQDLLGGLAAPLTKSQLALHDRRLQEKLAEMRSHIRDLELLAEEQDTCVRVRATFRVFRTQID
jgi:hypothetical protein